MRNCIIPKLRNTPIHDSFMNHYSHGLWACTTFLATTLRHQIDASPTAVMLGYHETNSRPLQCNPCDRHRRHRGLGRKPWLIVPQTKNRAGDSERLPAPDENQTRALQSSLHPLSAPTPSRAARRLRSQSTDRSWRSTETRKLVEYPQPHRRHY